jgi:hypothetical protein
MGNSTKIRFDAYEGRDGNLKIARNTDVVGELRTQSTDPDKVPANPRPAISDYPLEWDSGYDYAPWGIYAGDDNLPNRMEYMADLVPLIRQVQLRKAKMLMGNGLIYVKEADLAKTSSPERAYLPDVEDFNDNSQIETEWLLPQAMEWNLHANTFSELKLSMSRRFITNIFHKEAPYCRLTKQDARGVIKYLAYDALFAWNQHQRGAGFDATNGKAAGGTATLMPLLPWWDAYQFFQTLRGDTFAYHTRIRSGRSPYYARPAHAGLFRANGWVEGAADVPRILNSLQKNQITLKYQITVEESYFKIEHPEWDSYTSAQRSAALDRFEDKINDRFVGVDKAYSTILSVFRFDPLQSKELGKVEIVAIDDKLKHDSWIPGAEKANFEIVHGMGEHPTNFGLAREGGAMGAGSGSDKKEVWNSSQDLNNIEQKLLLWVLKFAYKFNKFGVVPMIDMTSHTTSNLSESGKVHSQNNPQPANAGGATNP